MPSESVSQRLSDIPVRNLKARLPEGEGEVQELNPQAGEALDEARRRSGLEPKQIADAVNVSHSLVCAALKSQKSISFHKLWNLSDEFWLELIFVIAKMRGIAHVRRQLEERERIGA